MKPEYPLSAEYRKNLASIIELLRKLTEDIKHNYTIEALEALRKELHKTAQTLGAYGYIEVNRLCKKWESDLTVQIKNFYLTKTSQRWFKELYKLPDEIEKIFLAQDQIMQIKNTTALEKEKKRTVVIVDDDEDLLKLLDYEFREIGFEVKGLKTGKEALDFLFKEENLHNVFLVILDRMLPDMDGLDILNQFLERSQIKIPVLILSALTAEKDILAGLQGGAVDYITKPFSVFMLMQKALNLLKTQS
jgi:CheY-like chemotaxis protein